MPIAKRAEPTRSQRQQPPAPAPAPERADAGPQREPNPLWHRLATGTRAGGAPRPPIQPKLTVGAPDTPYEREADRVADQVMRSPAGSPPAIQRLGVDEAQRVCADCDEEEEIQRQCAECEEEEEIQRQCADCEEEDEIQRQPEALEEEDEIQRTSGEDVGWAPAHHLRREPETAQRGPNGVPAVTPNVAGRIASLQSGGERLDAPTRAYFEPRFGRDFGDVRIHTGARAETAARALDARAFTLGRDVVFGAGQYAPETGAGRRLLAHELTHVVQQSATPGRPRLVARIPRHLPQTAGGLRLGRELDDGKGEALYDDLHRLLWDDDFEGVDARFTEEGGTLEEGLAFSDALESLVTDVAPAINELPEDVADELWNDFTDDLAALTYRRVADGVLDYARYEEQVVQVAATYENLAYLHRYEAQNPDVVPPGGEALGDWFRARARVFLDYAARARDRVDYAGLLAALAAETERLAHEDPSGPVSTARVLVGSLFQDGISDADMDAVGELYRTVLGGIPIAEHSPESLAVELLRHELGDSLASDVLEVEEALRDRDDEDRLDGFHRELGDEIARFLATVDAENPGERTRRHLDKVIEILRRYGVEGEVVVLYDAYEGTLSSEDEPEEEEAPEPEPVPEPLDLGPVYEPEREREREPEPAGEECEAEEYHSFDLFQWLWLYWDDNPAFWAFPFRAEKLLCGMGPPGTAVTATQAAARIGTYRRSVASWLRRLESHLQVARGRAKTIQQLKTSLFSPVEEQVSMLPEYEDQAAHYEEPPDYVHYFSLDDQAWYLLRDVFSEETFDPSFYLENLTWELSEHFADLGLYQDSLIRALRLTERMRESGADKLLLEELTEDWGPAVQRLLAAAEERPAWTTDSTELERAEGLDYAVTRLTGMTERAETTLRLRAEETLQQEIAEALPGAVKDLWQRQDEEGVTRTDAVRVSQVWPTPLRSRVEIPAGMDELAETYVELALEQYTSGILTELGVAAGAAAERADTLEIARLVARIESLQRSLGTDVLDAGVEALLDFNRPRTEYLIFVYVAAQTQLSLARGDGRLPGHVARTGKLMSIVMRERNLTTLHAIVDEMQGITGMVEALGIAQENFDEWAAGTNLSSIFDAPAIGLFAPYEMMGVVGNVAEGADDPKDVLYHLLAVEAAGGGEARGKALATIADLLRAQDTTGCYSAARLLYASALDVAPVIHEMLKPKEVIDAETLLNRRLTAMPGSSLVASAAERKKEREAEKAVEEYEKLADSTMGQLDAGRHPVAERALTEAERGWWSDYKDISGRGQILPGEEGWSELQDLGKELVFMVAVTAATGGAGGALRTAAGGSRIAGLGVTGLELATITGATRLRQSLVTGVDPKTSFLEDFAVNALSMGVGRLSQQAYNAAFRLGPATAGLGRHVAGRLAAEYVATSIVTRVHLSVSSALHGTPLTDEEVRKAYLNNAIFMVAMKARDILGTNATSQLRRDLGTAAEKQTIRRLLERLETRDKALDEAAGEAARGRTQLEREAALDRAEAAIREKRQLLETSRTKGLEDVAADFGAAARHFGREAAHARVYGRVNVEPVPNSRDMTYSKGGASERALIDHFNSSGADFQILEGAHGKIFEVRSADGSVVRFRPRPPRKVGGTTAETFLAVGRHGEEGVLVSGDHPRLAEILAADPQLDPGITSQLAAGQTHFLLTAGGAPTRVELKLVDDFSTGDQAHAPGPAQYRLEFRDGKFEVVVEVVTRATNDQIGRGVAHEVRELQVVIEKLTAEARAKGEDLTRYESTAVLDEAIARQREAGVLKPDSTATEPTAQDVAILEEFRYLGGKMREIHDALDARPSPAEAALLRERLRILEGEYRRAWRTSGLSTDPEVLKTQLGLFEAAGISLAPDVRSAVTEARFAASQGWETSSGLRILDLQIMLTELQKANPDLVAGSSILDVGAYYQERVAARAEAIFDAELARHGDRDLALSRAAESVRELLGGTSIASWRGRAFEGLSVAELNESPEFVAFHGQMHQLHLNNYPTFDAVSVKGTSQRLTIDETPRTNPDGTKTAKLLIFEQHTGVVVFEYLATRPPTTRTYPGFDVTLWSQKARGGYEMYQLYRAVGSDRTRHDAAGLLGTPEFADRLQISIDYSRVRFRNLQRQWLDGDTSVLDEMLRMHQRVLDLEHFRSRLEVSKGWTNARIDAYLRDLKASGLDLDAIMEGLYVRWAGGPALPPPTPAGTGPAGTGAGGTGTPPPAPSTGTPAPAGAGGSGAGTTGGAP